MNTFKTHSDLNNKSLVRKLASVLQCEYDFNSLEGVGLTFDANKAFTVDGNSLIFVDSHFTFAVSIHRRCPGYITF